MKTKTVLLILIPTALLATGYFASGALLGKAVAGTVNTLGPRLTGTTVTLTSARLSPMSGRGVLQDLRVGNPAGYKTPGSLAVARVEVDVDAFSLLRDTIVVESVLIERPEITLESKLTTSNLEEILDHLNEAVGSRGGGAPESGGGGMNRKLILRRFVLEGAQVSFTLADNTIVVPIPRLELNEIGTAKGGVTPAEASAEVLRQVLVSAMEAGAKSAAQQGFRERAKDFGKQLERSAKDLWKDLRN